MDVDFSAKRFKSVQISQDDSWVPPICWESAKKGEGVEQMFCEYRKSFLAQN